MVNSAKEYCKILSRLQLPDSTLDYYRFVLSKGQEFRSKPVPAALPKGINPRRFKVKECYYNAQMLALTHHFRYYEGFATSIIPTEHAWVLSDDGVLLDLTWDKVAEPDEEFDYFGVQVPTRFVAERLVKTSTSTPMLPEYWLSLQPHGDNPSRAGRGSSASHPSLNCEFPPPAHSH